MKFPDWLPVYGDTSFRGKCPLESAEQITFFNQIRSEHPKLIGGQHRSIDKKKAEGMSVGASDIVIPGAPAFVCELKRRDHTKCSWQDGQVEYLEVAHNAGAFVCVALGWEAAWQAFSVWLSTQETQ
jgi:hypothetical protein